VAASAVKVAAAGVARIAPVTGQIAQTTVAEAARWIEARFMTIHTGREVIANPEAAHAPSGVTITGAVVVAATASALTIVRMSDVIPATTIREMDAAYARMKATTGAHGMRKRATTFAVSRRGVALHVHTFDAATS
jgi:hypothetical protein